MGKIVLIALLFGICQARPGSLEFFEKTQETFGPEFQEEAGEYIKDIDEAFHGKQTGETDEYGWPVHDYESGLSGAIKGIWEDGEDMYKSLTHEVDWDKEMRDFRIREPILVVVVQVPLCSMPRLFVLLLLEHRL